jgi:hypothetical protein
MTRDEYESGRDFINEQGLVCPAPAELLRGGIIGSVTVTSGVTRDSSSPWFFGPRALVLEDPQPCDFIPSVGALGYFEWKPADASIVPPPARWMHPRVAEQLELPRNDANDLFSLGQHVPGVTE